MTFGDVPKSVALGRACSICWRNFENRGYHRQEVEGVSRNLCDSCASRLFPRMPAGFEGGHLIEVPVGGLVKGNCPTCGKAVDRGDGQCAVCWFAEHEGAWKD